MALTNIHSDWMSDASSGLGFFMYICTAIPIQSIYLGFRADLTTDSNY